MQRSTVHMMVFTLHRNRTRQPHLPTFLESLNLLLISVAILAANNATPTQDQKKSFKSNITEFWDPLSLCRCNPAHQPDLKPSTIKQLRNCPSQSLLNNIITIRINLGYIFSRSINKRGGGIANNWKASSETGPHLPISSSWKEFTSCLFWE